MHDKMTRILFFILIISNSVLGYGQIENRWQPDSVYSNKKVRRIVVYQNSPKDLSEIVEFDNKGRRIRVEKYSASYDRKTRKSKKIEMTNYFIYDSESRLIQTIDSIIYHHSSSVEINRTVFDYDGSYLISSKYFRGDFETPDSETTYTHQPYSSTTISRIDSVVMYHKTKEYDNGFYCNRFYGYSLEPKLKEGQIDINGRTESFQYADQADLQKFEDNETILNSFDENGRLIKSEIKSIFLNDRVNEYELKYDYFKNGLLRSVKGYVPLYFEYEHF